MEDIKSTFLNVTRAITKTSGDLLKTTKLSVAIANEEAALKTIYIEIGKKVHEIYAYGGNLGTFFDGKYEELVAAEARIEELKVQLDAAKGTKTCPACGKSAPKTAEFCPKCGKPMRLPETVAPATDYSAYDGHTAVPPEAAEPAAPAGQPAPKPAVGRRCAACNHQNNSDEKFCALCGRML